MIKIESKLITRVSQRLPRNIPGDRHLEIRIFGLCQRFSVSFYLDSTW